MQKPKIGQVLATNSGKQFRITDVSSTFDPDDSDSDPEGFMVYLAEFHGLDSMTAEWEDADLLDSEFEAWCESNGVSY